AERAVMHELRLAIAKMQLALGKARGMAKQPSHGVADAIGVFQPLAQYHVAAALAVHGPRGGELREAAAKLLRRGKRPRLQLGIAAGQPAAVAACRRRLIGKRRERDDLGAGASPAVENVRIDES